MSGLLRSLGARWTAFFDAPFDLRRAAAMRIVFAVLVLLNLGFLGADLGLFFGPDGVMPLDASIAILDPDAHTIFEWLPDTRWVTRIAYGLAMLHVLGLLVGWYPRLQAFGVFFWLVAFQHRHIMIFDGEDQVFRLFALFFVFVPSYHHYSLHAAVRDEPGPETGPAWGLRFVQIQMTLVYLGTAVAKLRGDVWLDGTALYYISRLDDVFGRFPVPDFLFDSLGWVKALTWGTLAFEVAMPIALWIPRTRKAALVAAAAFHVALDYSMNLFLFHPIMLVGLLAFLAGPVVSPSTRAPSCSPPGP